ncbi:MAG: hypothetical protein EA377_02360 [Phycisphaerales bacterium]|nr:MAG: hypothetical protein EA377_02360 [Phycisphaerales bacterium]
MSGSDRYGTGRSDEHAWLPSTRSAVAGLLHRARQASEPERQLELLQRASMLLSHRRVVQRRIARAWIDAGDEAQADAHLARCLECWPEDPILLGRRAETALRLRRLQRAAYLIEAALLRAPQRVELIELAATIARERGLERGEAYYLSLAVLLKPKRMDLQRRLVRAWLDAGDAERADRVLRTLPPAEQDRHLVARTALDCGRPLDGLAALGIEGRRTETFPTLSPHDLTLALRLAEAAGNHPLLRRLRKRAHEMPHPESDLAVAVQFLREGRFHAAVTTAFRWRHHEQFSAAALTIVLVAAGMKSRRNLVRRSLQRLWHEHGGPNRRETAALWRDALLGATLDPRTVFEDRSGGGRMLPMLLERAAVTFATAADRARSSSRGEKAAEMDRHRRVCLTALGRADDPSTLPDTAGDLKQGVPSLRLAA